MIVGAGPAGVAAALWARDRFQVTVLERWTSAGGQLRAIHFTPPELPGIESGDGPQLAEACARQLERSGADVRYGAEAVWLETHPNPAVRVRSGEWFHADAVLIATGLSRRRLGVPGEKEFAGRGVSLSASRDRDSFSGQDVLVVGGGDGALESALLLAEVGCRVTVAARAVPRANAEFQRRVAASPLIEVRPRTRVQAFLGEQQLEAARLESPSGVAEQPFAGAVIKIGSAPNSDWCKEQLDTYNGFVRVQPTGRTSVAAVWAAGDVTGPPLFAISVAESGAGLAIHDAAALLEAGVAR